MPTIQAPAATGTLYEPGSMPRQKLMILSQQFVGSDETVDAPPGTNRGSQQRQRRMTHLVAAIRSQGTLRRHAVFERPRVVLQWRTCVVFASVGPQARRCILLGVNENRHQMHLLPLCAELVL